MKKIGIIGASSQVGSSVALYLKRFEGVDTTCFIRSGYGEIFFELFNIRYFNISTNSREAYENELKQMDVVLDFTYPTGQLYDILSSAKENIGRTLKAMQAGKMYFYMSSIMAYGMPENHKWINNYAIPRSSYAYIKREIEKYTVQEGKKQQIDIYNFRLGQVHGFLQSVNVAFRKKLGENKVALIDGHPTDKVNVIFIYSLCEAILQCINGVNKPGLYTLVFDPQWSLQDLYEYYKSYYKIATSFEFRPSDEKRKKKKSILALGIAYAKPYRSMLETYLLMKAPKLAVRIKGSYRQHEFSQQEHLETAKYIDYNLLGRPPLKMISGLTTDIEKIKSIERDMEDYYNSVIISSHK